MELLIIGSGLAGLSAAITAVENGDSVTLLSADYPERAQSVLASGGINAAIDTKGEQDSPEQHFADTMKAGCDLADAEAVRGLTAQAPALIRELAARGVAFSRDQDGNPDTRYFGGQKKSRTVFARAGIGKQLVSGLAAELLRYYAQGRVRLLMHHRFLRCILAEGCCAGIIAEDTVSGELLCLSSDALIIACGGPGALFGKTTGSRTSDGLASASLFRSGLKMANLEMIQFHPTTLETPQKRMLISEAARGEGARLFTLKDGQRWYFMEDWYGPRGNLMPRDIVSRCIYKVCTEMKLGLGGERCVGLDLTHLDRAVITDRLKEIYDTCLLYRSLDPCREYIPVYPGVHYFMGGILTDRFHRTSIPGLYAAGECACQYHGANRLGGNSTLGAIYGGRMAARSAAGDLASGTAAAVTEAGRAAALRQAGAEIRRLEECCADRTGENPSRLLQDLQIIINLQLGIERNPERLEEGLRQLKELQGRRPAFRKGHAADALAAEDLPILGEALLRSALARRETRGAHVRIDYPERDDENFRKNMVAVFREGHVLTETEEIGRIFNERSSEN